MILVSLSDFVFPYVIPNASRMENTLSTFIQNEQENILREVLGDKLYEDFITGISVATPQQKWVDLRDGKSFIYAGHTHLWKGMKSVLRPWIYSKWVRYNITHFTGIGTVKSDAENSMVISSVFVEATFHNEAADNVHALIAFIESGVHSYSYDRLKPLGYMNAFSL